MFLFCFSFYFLFVIIVLSSFAACFHIDITPLKISTNLSGFANITHFEAVLAQ